MDDFNITAEVHRVIDAKIEAGCVVNVTFVAAEVLAGKPNIEGDDAPFYRVCTHKEIVRIAKRAIGKYDAEDVTDKQLVLPGFKHLSKAYPMERDGSIVLVPVNICTADELLARASQLDEMAKGCVAHAREIREYVLVRDAEAA